MPAASTTTMPMAVAVAMASYQGWNHLDRPEPGTGCYRTAGADARLLLDQDHVPRTEHRRREADRPSDVVAELHGVDGCDLQRRPGHDTGDAWQRSLGSELTEHRRAVIALVEGERVESVAVSIFADGGSSRILVIEHPLIFNVDDRDAAAVAPRHEVGVELADASSALPARSPERQ